MNKVLNSFSMKYQKNIDKINKIAQEQYDRVKFLSTEKGQGPLTSNDKEFTSFPSKLGTTLMYRQKDNQNYYENLKQKQKEQAKRIALSSLISDTNIYNAG